MLVQITWAIILKNETRRHEDHLSSPIKSNRQILLLGLRSW